MPLPPCVAASAVGRGSGDRGLSGERFLKIRGRMRRVRMKRLMTTLIACGMAAELIAGTAAAGTFVVGFQPCDIISYQAIINAELGLWKK